MESQVRSRQFFECFLVKVCTFSVLERLENKDYSRSTCSSPSPFGWLRDCLVAETVQTLVFLDGYRFFSLNEDPVQVLAVCEELPVQVQDLVDGCWFFSLKGELVYRLVRRGVFSLKGDLVQACLLVQVSADIGF